MSKKSISDVSRGTGRWGLVADVSMALSSYCALFIALAIRFECPGWLRTLCICLAVAGGAATFYFLATMKLLNSDTVSIETVDDRGGDVSGYLATYLLPLLVVGAPNTRDIWAYGIVLGVMGLIYVRSRMIQINPTFHLLMYRLYFITTDSGFEGYLLTRTVPRANDQLSVVRRGRFLLEIKDSG